MKEVNNGPERRSFSLKENFSSKDKKKKKSSQESASEKESDSEKIVYEYHELEKFLLCIIEELNANDYFLEKEATFQLETQENQMVIHSFVKEVKVNSLRPEKIIDLWKNIKKEKKPRPSGSLVNMIA